ncbi:MAG: leucyl/phenylalanyl-tRNA--protein transferase [Bacteroidetes bacterium]|nr:leucyl/phenylalanyl-tRNA--protein transferase [Bacteroidota bacterium]
MRLKKSKPIILAEELIWAYSQGIFPMSDESDSEDVIWYTAIKRGIIPMDGFKVSKNVKQRIKQGKFKVTIDKAFKKVMKACAERETTWISGIIIRSYYELFKLGYAHSVEIWSEDGSELIGGLYGASLGKAFFGESMFKRQADADKIALYFAHQWLRENNYLLWDTQFWTPHLAQFGCIEIDAEDYQMRLKNAIK